MFEVADKLAVIAESSIGPLFFTLCLIEENDIMIYLLLTEALFMTILSKKIFKSMVTSYMTIMLPYVIIAALNNIIFVHFGFIPVENNTVALIMIASLFFYIGMMFVSRVNITLNGKGNKLILNIKWVYRYVSVVIIIRILEIIYRVRAVGFGNLSNDDFSLMINHGITGHLMLSIFPLMPVIFFYWLEGRKKNTRLILLYGIYIAVCFVETEKAQVIAPIIAAFLYCVYKNEKYLTKGLLYIFISVPIFFMGNYAIKFLLQGSYSTIPLRYYLYRLWNYIAGGIINTNTLLKMDVTTNAFDYLLDVIFAFPNMITNRLFGFTLGSKVIAHLPIKQEFLRTTILNDAWGYQDNNVYGTLSLIYGNGNIFVFAVVVMFWGTISQLIFNKMKNMSNDSGLLVCVCYMTFSFLTFFSSYYTIASFMERIIWSVVMCYILRFRRCGNSINLRRIKDLQS